MAYSKDINAYPIVCFRAVEDVLSNGSRLSIPCENAREAQAWRMRFYGLRYALSFSDHPLKDQAAKLQFRVDGKSLIIEHIEDYDKFREFDQRVINAIEESRKRAKP